MNTELFFREKVHDVYPEAMSVVREGCFFAVYDSNPGSNIHSKCLSGEYLHTKSLYAWEAAYNQTMQNVVDSLSGETNFDPNWRGPKIRRV